jgi:hypothetical protein|tara:strand:- start:15 stop:248 length:234 start_codon:yes stop_codon:yes gene_type:complete
MFQDLDYGLIRYDDDTYGLHEVYTENGEIKGILSDLLIEGSSPADIIEKLNNILRRISQEDTIDMDAFRSNPDDFLE